MLHCSAEDLGPGRSRRRGEEDAEGWCTVRRSTRSKVSPGQVRRQSKYSASNRYRMPSSAMSMPSLALGDLAGGRDQEQERSKRPQLEKSSSSASMGGREVTALGGLGHLGESQEDTAQEQGDPGCIKKQKDLLNHSKQQALRSLSGEGEDGRARLEKAASCPLQEVVQVHRSAEPEVQEQDPEAEEREKAIAIADLELCDLRRAVTETEQAELTDTDCDGDTDNYTTDTESNETRSELGAPSDIASRYEALLEGLSWAEQLELEEQLGDPSTLEARLPGRGIQLHEKLSSPARRKEPHETFQHYQEKQAKARQRRLVFCEEKASKLAVLNMRIEEAMEQRDKLVGERKETIDMKLKRAEENRILHIEGIRKKAHEEEEKLKEIAFINSLQAQNARMDMITQVRTKVCYPRHTLLPRWSCLTRSVRRDLPRLLWRGPRRLRLGGRGPRRRRRGGGPWRSPGRSR